MINITDITHLLKLHLNKDIEVLLDSLAPIIEGGGGLYCKPEELERLNKNIAMLNRFIAHNPFLKITER